MREKKLKTMYNVQLTMYNEGGKSKINREEEKTMYNV